MFDIGWPELLVVAIVLIIVVGPKDLPKMLRAFGRTTKKMRQMAGEFRGQFDEALKEADLDDVRKTINEARSLNPMNQIRDAVNPLKQAGEDIKQNLKDSVIDGKPSGNTVDKSSAKSETGDAGKKADKPFVVPDSDIKLSGDAPKIDAPASKTKVTDTAPVTALAAKPATKSAAKPKAKSRAKATTKTAGAKAQTKAAAAKPAAAAKAKASDSGKSAAKPAATRRKPATGSKAASRKGQA